MILTEAKITRMNYNEAGEQTTRTVIPMSVPKDFMRAIDVAELDPEAQQRMETLIAEYKEYMATIMKSAFTFENWVDHTYNEEITPKWRSFKLAKITDAD